MQHLGTCQLNTSRLILRRFELDDTEAVYNNWTSDNYVKKYLKEPIHENIKTSKKMLADLLLKYEQTDCYDWAITIRGHDNKPVGSISVKEQNDRTEAFQLGYVIGKKWWSQGIATEALMCVIHFLFSEVGVNRIEARHDTRNPGSGKVMQKCGMIYEGTMRSAGKNNSGICNLALYSILKEEYCKADKEGNGTHD